ncbi:serine hydrolase domain-containing protein [Kitasatospora sp. NPDC094019]|uniref:serine hydrolase domain-containing protein n=1 Tax=Kitasatospora sp. NPDC094019 TaxID=3364091 RepID=UPI003810DEBC
MSRRVSRSLAAAAVAALCLGTAVPASADTSAFTSASASADTAAPAATAVVGGPLQPLLKGMTDAGAVSVIAKVTDGRQVWTGSSGVSDLTGRAPVDPEGRFRIASVTKTFVATTVLQLVGEHRLGLDDPVARHLPSLLPEGQSAITVRQLLNQRTGLFDPTNDGVSIIPDPGNDMAFRTWAALGGLNRTYTPAGKVAASVLHGPLFAPGERWDYSNTNFDVLGLLVEKVTGHSYGEEITRRVLRPLGMNRTFLPGTSTGVPGPHAHGYTDGVDVTEQNPSWIGAAGEMVSTTGDLLRFGRALLQGRLLPPAQQQEMTTMLATGAAPTYGMGLAGVRLSCTTVLGHNGEVLGFKSDLWGTPDRQLALSYAPGGDAAAQAAQSAAEFKLLEAAFCGAA